MKTTLQTWYGSVGKFHERSGQMLVFQQKFATFPGPMHTHKISDTRIQLYLFYNVTYQIADDPECFSVSILYEDLLRHKQALGSVTYQTDVAAVVM